MYECMMYSQNSCTAMGLYKSTAPDMADAQIKITDVRQYRCENIVNMSDIEDALNALFIKLDTQIEKRQSKRVIKTCDESTFVIEICRFVKTE